MHAVLKMKCSGKWGKSSTWPPTTAMVGSDSQRVGRSPPPPWSPRAVQARWMRFISPIRPSMEAMIFFLFLFDLPLCFASETRLLRNRAFSWARGGMEEPKTEGRLTERRRFEEESPGKKENLPAKEAKPRRQGRRRPPPRMMTRFALNSTGQLSHGRRLAGQLFCLLAQAQAQPRMAHILSFSLSFFFPTFRQLQPPSPSVRVRVRAPRAPLHLLLGEGGICQQIPP